MKLILAAAILILSCLPVSAGVVVTGRVGCEMFGMCASIPSVSALGRCRVVVSNGAGETVGSARFNQFGHYWIWITTAMPVDSYHFGYEGCASGIGIQYERQDWQFVDGSFNIVRGGIVFTGAAKSGVEVKEK